MILVAALIILAYLAFVFFSETSNPIVRPRGHVHRSKWRYGRRMALAVLMGGFSALLLLDLADIARHIAVGIGVMVASVLGLCFSFSKIRHVMQR